MYERVDADSDFNMNSYTWHKISEFCRNREAMAHQRELARRHDWKEEESEDGRGGDVDRRVTMFGSLAVYCITLLVLGVLLFSCRRAQGADAVAMVDALAMVESGNNPHARGRAGEVTEFQFKPGTLAEANHGWRKYNKVQGSSSNPPARLAASFYVGKLFQQLTIATGRAPTPQELYAVWNIGFHAYRRNGFTLSRCPKATQDRARRFANLVEFYTVRRVAGSPDGNHRPFLAGSTPAPAPR
jgi:hypothetical protein